MKFKLHSILALVLVVAMAVTLFAACGAKSTDTSATASSASGSTTPTTAAKSPVEISIYANGDQFTTFDPSKDDIAKYIHDKFNLTFKPVVLQGDALKLAATSNSLPDVFYFGFMYDTPTFNSWISQGIIRDIPDAMIAKYPNVKKEFDNNTTIQQSKQLFGKNYYIPIQDSIDQSLYKVDASGVYVRKDWLDALSMKEPTNFDELYNVLKAYVNNDPDKNGKKDTYGLTTDDGVSILMNWFTAWGIKPDDWVFENNQWIPGYMSRKNIEPLKYLQKLYQEGLLDTEFANNSPNQAMQKFAGDTFGVIARNADTYWVYRVIVKNFGAANKSISDPLSAVDLLMPLGKDANSKPAIAEKYTSDGVLFRAGCEDEKVDRYLEFHNWLLTDEAKTMMNIGFEGKQYTKDASGKIVTFNDPSTGAPYSTNQLFPTSNLYMMASWGMDMDADLNWPSPTIRDNVKQLAQKVRDARNQYPFPVNSSMMMISTPAKDQLTLDFNGEFTAMVMGKDDISAAFDKFLKKCNDSGAAQAIKEATDAANKAGIKPATVQ